MTIRGYFDQGICKKGVSRYAVNTITFKWICARSRRVLLPSVSCESPSFYYETVYSVISSCVFWYILVFCSVVFFCIILEICNSSVWFSHLLPGFVFCPILRSCCVSLCFACASLFVVVFCTSVPPWLPLLWIPWIFIFFYFWKLINCHLEWKSRPAEKTHFFFRWMEPSLRCSWQSLARFQVTAASLAGPWPATCRNTWRPKGLHIQTPGPTYKSKWLLTNEP